MTALLTLCVCVCVCVCVYYSNHLATKVFTRQITGYIMSVVDHRVA